MIAVNPAALTGTPVDRMAASVLCIVRLIDRRTGLPHRINGVPLQLFSRQPQEAAADLLRNRDPRVWDAEIQPLGTATPATTVRQ